jgi:hypothetical protein
MERSPYATRDAAVMPRPASQVPLDPHCVAEHVQLGYAVTVHRTQGATVDTCHVAVSPGITGEALYVAMTMARQANSAFVVTTPPVTDFEVHPVVNEDPTAHEVLFKVPATEAAERSATEQVSTTHRTGRHTVPAADCASKQPPQTSGKRIDDARYRD